MSNRSVTVFSRVQFPSQKSWRIIAFPVLVLMAILFVPAAPGQSVSVIGPDNARAADFQLKAHRDRLFRYRKPLQVLDGGNFKLVPYDPKRDINERDIIPVRKVHSMYVSLRPKKHEQDLSMEANGRTVTWFAVGPKSGASKMTVIFLHGRDGSRHLGFDDERFGGNFNRVKNLVYRNGGTYISADFADFEEKGKQDVAAIIARYRSQTAGPLILTCGSMGSFVCWRLASDPETAAMIDGLVFLGGFANPAFLGTPMANDPGRHMPIYIAHGEIDYVYKWTDMQSFYKALRGKNYPVRLTVFNGGKHGTPVRMIDWREALNWIIREQP